MRDYGIFSQCLNKIATIYTIDIKLKEKQAAMVLNCHHNLCVCVCAD